MSDRAGNGQRDEAIEERDNAVAAEEEGQEQGEQGMVDDEASDGAETLNLP